ncbi:unnamed protein product [Musa textilis]
MCLMFSVLMISLETCSLDLYEKHEYTHMNVKSLEMEHIKKKKRNYTIMMLYV